MTQHFKFNHQGNIEGVCPKDGKTKHYTVCRDCEKCESMPTLMGKPVGRMICKSGGIEGMNFNQWKRKRKD